MKRKVVLRGLLGFPQGVALGYAITLLLSLGWGNGEYLACTLDLANRMGSEIGAVLFQAILSGLIGSAFAASSVIWEMKDWSIIKQTGAYFLITASVMLPVAYFAGWMERSITGFLCYLGVFAIIFLAVWFIQYVFWKKKIRQMNSKIIAKKV